MTMTTSLGGQAEVEMKAAAERYGVRPAVVAKALIESVIDAGDIDRRLRSMDLEAVAKRSVGPRGAFYYQGRRVTAKAIAEIAGLDLSTVTARLRSGWSVERTIKTPRRGSSAA